MSFRIFRTASEVFGIDAPPPLEGRFSTNYYLLHLPHYWLLMLLGVVGLISTPGTPCKKCEKPGSTQ